MNSRQQRGAGLCLALALPFAGGAAGAASLVSVSLTADGLDRRDDPAPRTFGPRHGERGMGMIER